MSKQISIIPEKREDETIEQFQIRICAPSYPTRNGWGIQL